MTLALSEGGLVHTHAEMERAFQRQPEGPTKFQTPHHQQNTSPRPKSADNTLRVHQVDPPPQREQRLFRRHSKAQIAIAVKRMTQLEAVVLDNHGGPCLTPRAIEYVEEYIPLAAIAGGQASFDWLLGEIVMKLAPRISPDAVEAAVERVLLDPLPYTSAAIGKRLGVTIEQYDRLGLSHIWPAGWTKRRLNTFKRKRRAAKVKAARQANGTTRTPRELSIARLKPWTLPGAPCRTRTEFYALPAADREALVARARAEAREHFRTSL